VIQQSTCTEYLPRFAPIRQGDTTGGGSGSIAGPCPISRETLYVELERPEDTTFARTIPSVWTVYVTAYFEQPESLHSGLI